MPNRLRSLIASAIFAAISSDLSAAPVALLPIPNSKDVPPDMPLSLSVSGPTISLGSGKIEIHDAADDSLVTAIDLAQPTRPQTIGGLPNYVVRNVNLDGPHATVSLPPGTLKYGKTYYITCPGSAFTGMGWNAEGISGKGMWNFSTKAAPPAADSARLTVDAAGKGDFATIQGAIDFLPEGNSKPRVILIKAGTYNEIICLMHRDHVTLLGEDRKNTILAYPNNDRFNNNSGGNPFGAGAPQPGAADPAKDAVYRRGVVLAHRVTDLTIANLTIHNTTPHGGSQAETIIANGSPDGAHLILTGLDLISFQDTIQINGQAYISDTNIDGDVDFMWGTGPSFFQSIHARAVTNGVIFTTVRCPPPPNTNHGFVFKDCTFDGAAGVTGTFLARVEANRFPTSETILLNTSVSATVAPAGWRAPTGGDASQVHYWELNSHDEGGKPINTAQRIAQSKQLDAEKDKATIAQYSDPAFVLNPAGAASPWKPSLGPIIGHGPASVSAKAGSPVSLEVQAAAIPAATYQWQKDGKDIAGATGPFLRLERPSAADAGSYTVVVANSLGRVICEPAKVAITP